VTTLNRKVRDAGKNGTGGTGFQSGCNHCSRFFMRAKFNQRRRGCMQYWLMKSEPDDVSIDDALSAPAQIVPWVGVRNYQARNFMRDLMRVGDGVLFYHSSCAEPGIAGLAEVASTAYPDPTQFDAKSRYFDPKASPEQPRWVLVDIKARKKTRLLTLAELRSHPDLADMQVLRRGNRLSITPVTSHEWHCIARLL
jgi:predicted RNA-binding protein with PUA-like domain